MSRYRAAAIHFSLSAVVFVGLAYLIVFVWYPRFFFETDGGWQGIRIIVLVDLVLGPLLTLIVFKTGKPGLKFDLATIASVQIACLMAGTWVVWNERPLALVYVDGYFHSMNAAAYKDAGVEVPDLSEFPGATPKWVMVDIPTDFTAQAEVRGSMLDIGRPLRALTERYVPFDPRALDDGDAFPSDELVERVDDPRRIETWTARHGALSDYRFYLYGARYTFALLAFDAQDRRFAGVLEPAPVKAS